LQIRVGHGYDIHRFAENRNLVLGGVNIPNATGLLGHSDADVVLHALMDALLGAIGLEDIGHYFPPSDEQLRDCSSLLMLHEVVTMITNLGWQCGNVDISLIAEQPKVSHYRELMRNKIAEALAIAPDCVGIKATTNEKIGALGRGEGIACFAVVLVTRC
jgi:2-C-methyl-D-erythritol 2,4-cyclodiphosphate synthase